MDDVFLNSYFIFAPIALAFPKLLSDMVIKFQKCVLHNFLDFQVPLVSNFIKLYTKFFHFGICSSIIIFLHFDFKLE